MGIHARAAARLVSVAGRYRSRVALTRLNHNEEIDGKSILGILMLAASPGTAIVFTVDGPDETAALEAIERLVQAHFQEGAAS